MYRLGTLFSRLHMRESPLPPPSPFLKVRNVDHLIVFRSVSSGATEHEGGAKDFVFIFQANQESAHFNTLSRPSFSPLPFSIFDHAWPTSSFSPAPAFSYSITTHPQLPTPPLLSISHSILLYCPPRILLLLHSSVIHSLINFNLSPSPPHHHYQYPAATQYYKH